jgi:hypothetical protein
MPAIKHPVKINVDLGEGYGNFKCGPDEELIPLIDHANIACGFHAGYDNAYYLYYHLKPPQISHDPNTPQASLTLRSQ